MAVSTAQHPTRYDTISPLALGGLAKADARMNAGRIQWTNIAKASRTAADRQGARDETSQ
jgi:hypothetical protein